MSFLIRRFVHNLFLLLATSVLSFTLTCFAPGDFYDSMKLNPEISPATVASLRREHGLERPLPLRYLSWVRSGLQGNWGLSFAYGRPAAPIVLSRAKNTLLLAGFATLFAWLVALPLGTRAATHPGRWSDSFASGTILVFLATPELVLGVFLLMVAVRTGFFPAGGLTSVRASDAESALATWTRARDVAAHLILPCICLVAGLLPMLLLHIRSAVKEALQAPFIEAARAYGIPFSRILLRYVLPAAANPLISLFGLSLGMLLSSSLLVEVIFSWPGLGKLLVEAILQRDIFLVIDSSMVATISLIAGTFLADVLLFANDPRIRSV